MVNKIKRKIEKIFFEQKFIQNFKFTTVQLSQISALTENL